MILLAAILGGLFLLAYCGDRLVESAAALAERAGVSPAVVGLTVVAAGTSAPELFVSVLAVLSGSPDIAAGNVVGSNIANITLVLGATALFSPVPIAGTVIRLDYPFMAFSSGLMLLLCRDRVFDRVEAAFFTASLCAFVVYAVMAARAASKAEIRELGGLVPAPAAALSHKPYAAMLGGLAASIAGLSVGAKLLVFGASGVALRLGVSERVIGLTIVAVGTSLPELVASIQAARKGRHEMALANLIGSNIFNVLGILGVAGLARPVRLSAGIVGVDLWVMMSAALALAPLVYWRRRVSRPSGALLLGFYALYILSVSL